MKFLLSLAWKNLSRYTKRTIITAVAIAFGLMMFMVVDSILKGAEIDSERNLLWYETGSAKVLHPDYWDEVDRLPLKYTVDNPGEVIADLKAQGYPAVPRIIAAGELIIREDPFPQDGSMQVKVVAIDPLHDGDVYRLERTLEEGSYLQPGKEGFLIGAWLAEDIGAEIGYPLTLRVRTKPGSYETIESEIVGILNVPNPQVNKGTVFMPLDMADYYFDMEGTVTEVTLAFPFNLNPDTEAVKIEEQLPQHFNGLEVVSWKILAADYVAMAVAKRSGSSTILFLVFIIAAVGITNTMLMAVYERRRELGMMRAMGMKDSQIRLAFIFEAGGIGFIGAVMGVILGCLINWPLVKYGLDYSSLLRDFDIGYRLTGVFRGRWNVSTIVTAFIAGIVISMLVAYIPTRKALKMQITDCLRDE